MPKKKKAAPRKLKRTAAKKAPGKRELEKARLARAKETVRRTRLRLPSLPAVKVPAPMPPEIEGPVPGPGPRPVSIETRKEFETQTLYTQVRKQRAKDLVVAIRTSYYLPRKTDFGPNPMIKTSHKKGSNLYQRDIRKGTISIRGKVQYIRIKKEELKKGAIEELVRGKVRAELKKFDKSNYNSFTASVQIIKGKIVNPYTIRVAANGKVSKAAFFPAFSKKTKIIDEKRKKEELKTIQENNLITMESMLYNVYEYGLRNRWSAKESRKYRKERRRSDRGAKHAAEEGEE